MKGMGQGINHLFLKKQKRELREEDLTSKNEIKIQVKERKKQKGKTNKQENNRRLANGILKLGFLH